MSASGAGKALALPLQVGAQVAAAFTTTFFFLNYFLYFFRILVAVALTTTFFYFLKFFLYFFQDFGSRCTHNHLFFIALRELHSYTL